MTHHPSQALAGHIGLPIKAPSKLRFRRSLPHELDPLPDPMRPEFVHLVASFRYDSRSLVCRPVSVRNLSETEDTV